MSGCRGSVSSTLRCGVVVVLDVWLQKECQQHAALWGGGGAGCLAAEGVSAARCAMGWWWCWMSGCRGSVSSTLRYGVVVVLDVWLQKECQQHAALWGGGAGCLAAEGVSAARCAMGWWCWMSGCRRSVSSTLRYGVVVVLDVWLQKECQQHAALWGGGAGCLAAEGVSGEPTPLPCCGLHQKPPGWRLHNAIARLLHGCIQFPVDTCVQQIYWICCTENMGHLQSPTAYSELCASSVLPFPAREKALGRSVGRAALEQSARDVLSGL